MVAFLVGCICIQACFIRPECISIPECPLPEEFFEMSEFDDYETGISRYSQDVHNK